MADQSEAPLRTAEFDRAAQIWVQRHCNVTPDLGSVRFEVDAAAYASGAWCNFSASWETGGSATRTGQDISDEAWDYDATALMRELVEIAVTLDAEVARFTSHDQDTP